MNLESELKIVMSIIIALSFVSTTAYGHGLGGDVQDIRMEHGLTYNYFQELHIWFLIWE
jgi:hypothetical protein